MTAPFSMGPLISPFMCILVLKGFGPGCHVLVCLGLAPLTCRWDEYPGKHVFIKPTCLGTILELTSFERTV